MPDNLEAPAIEYVETQFHLGNIFPFLPHLFTRPFCMQPHKQPLSPIIKQLTVKTMSQPRKYNMP